MKLFVFCIAALALLPMISGAFHKQTRDDLEKAQDACIWELNVPSKLAEKYRNFDFPQEAKTGCYLQCLMDHLNLYDIQKGFLVDNIVTQLTNGNKERATSLERNMLQCLSQQPDLQNVCLWIQRNFNCFLKEQKDAVWDSFQE